MRAFVRLVMLGICLGAFAGPVHAQYVNQTVFRKPAPQVDCCPPAQSMQTLPPGRPQTAPGQEPVPGQEGQPGAQAPATDAFAQGPPAGGAEGRSSSPTMFGDLIGGPNVNGTFRLRGGATISGSVPLVFRGAYKIGENETPRPTDRLFFTYNYYNNVNTSINGSGTPAFDLHREMIGFEKTFFDGSASFAVRLPIMQTVAGSAFGFDPNQMGDLTTVFKWAFYDDRETGNLVSTGMALTFPTGDTQFDIPGVDLHSTVYQPFLGYIWNNSNWYLQGFSSIIVPTASSDATIMLNDIGLGYWIYKDRTDRFITGIVPTLEGHLTTPLNHRGADTEPFGIADWFVVTGGVYFVLPGNSTLGMALCTPLTGPKPYDLEAAVSFNYRF